MRQEGDRVPKPARTFRGASERTVTNEFSHANRSLEYDVLSSRRAALNSQFDTWVVGC